MTEVFIYSALALFGAALGSFVTATVWRIRARQLESDKKAGEEYHPKEYATLKKLLGKKTAEDRSQCLHCHKTLSWYELIPVVSWVVQRGKCRSCKKFIGWFEVLAEVGLAVFFVLSYALWPTALSTPLEVTHFVLWLIGGVIMALLFAYDMKWFLLPDVPMIVLIIIGLAVTVLTAVTSDNVTGSLLSAAGAVAALGGLYALLYYGSKGRWVGFGDVILGVGLGLLLADWRLALVALFMANFIGCLFVIPLMIAGKLKRNSHVPFGPLLIAGAVVAWFAGPALIEWYVGGMGFTF
ncbi:prepilin peptidase [Candidatus Saccharibacteria bacterium TM7i]|nr:prepilin peptidase [Candidatus Saccharibacteria bacterium TM7i]